MPQGHRCLDIPLTPCQHSLTHTGPKNVKSKRRITIVFDSSHVWADIQQNQPHPGRVKQMEEDLTSLLSSQNEGSSLKPNLWLPITVNEEPQAPSRGGLILHFFGAYFGICTKICFLSVGNRGRLYANFEIPHAENWHWKTHPCGAPTPQGDVQEIQEEKGPRI